MEKKKLFTVKNMQKINSWLSLNFIIEYLKKIKKPRFYENNFKWSSNEEKNTMDVIFSVFWKY